ncbi:hypothetical protein [Pontimicrobium sp. SW4]|uniref:DUF3078 domain-containing protein n=1 Tax=Pontimicrobium sp. SW4 TaxID=3153519 RepID=A0AAU7BRN2_9FLAO
MKLKKVTCVLMCFASFLGYAQIDKEHVKKDLEEKQERYVKTLNIYNKEKDKFDTLVKNKSFSSIKEVELKKLDSLISDLNKIFEEAQLARNYYLQSDIKDLADGVKKDSLDKFYNINKYSKVVKEEAKKEEAKVYLYFGDKKIIEKDKFFNRETEDEIIKDMLNRESESYFGNFSIPEKEKDIFLVEYKEKADNSFSFEYSPKSYKFHKIDLELYEGSLVDIKLFLKDSEGSVYLFENKIWPISLLRFSKTAYKFYLQYSSKQKKGIDEIDDGKYKDEKYYVRLSDVLQYINKPGKNFVPDDQNFSFPIEDENTSPTVYELRQDTSLKNVLELRAYTDFLGLFNDDPNGIVQFEGDASFYIFPFRYPNTNIYYLKKIKPYVRFSRFDEGDNIVQINSDSLVNGLDVIKKTYLSLGVKLDVLNFKFSKELPFEVNIYGAARYNVANVAFDAEKKEKENYKAMGLGVGANLDFRRFDNFGFNLSTEFIWYNLDDWNNYNQIIDMQKHLLAFKLESEISYFPASSKTSAIFLRLKVFNDIDRQRDSNFFQFQFGYKFSVGLNAIKK